MKSVRYFLLGLLLTTLACSGKSGSTGPSKAELDAMIAASSLVYKSQTITKTDNENDGVIDAYMVTSYNQNGRTLHTDIDNNQDGIIEAYEDYTYDANNNTITSNYHRNPPAYTDSTYTYDSNNNQIDQYSNGQDIHSVPFDRHFHSTYNAQNKRTELLADNNNDGIYDIFYNYTFDATGLLEIHYETGNVGSAPSTTTDYTYNAQGLLQISNTDDVIPAFDLIVTNTYDSDGNKIMIENDNGANGTVDSKITYDYDSHHNITRYTSYTNDVIDGYSIYQYTEIPYIFTKGPWAMAFDEEDTGYYISNRQDYDGSGNLTSEIFNYYAPDGSESYSQIDIDGDENLDKNEVTLYDIYGYRSEYYTDNNFDDVKEFIETYENSYTPLP
ncbi:hypothetical protein K1X76_11885 [bacterium]|nr:hypothetical protein [bacterium]